MLDEFTQFGGLLYVLYLRTSIMALLLLPITNAGFLKLLISEKLKA